MRGGKRRVMNLLRRAPRRMRKFIASLFEGPKSKA
jgi:hypothetical protein